MRRPTSIGLLMSAAISVCRLAARTALLPHVDRFDWRGAWMGEAISPWDSWNAGAALLPHVD
ncbi:hypothetical protein O3I_029730 [Nocardia brasiliensis ATCC 700358]|uniref:Uncharacterized protein n=1 Tax=Nocardia brasiliensis (strain ATCC 700358 / HUJEG-1) TaxID=1133849 RepID=K0F415_NOCB7|nr:hypothetical protein O3I_029730 [Nocardia brasiliensis ATCC 700358]